MFTQIPTWTHEGATPSTYTFFAAIALAGLENKYIRISANDQRKLLGHPVFGKREIKVNGNEVYSVIKIAFGADFEDATYTASKIQQAVVSKKSLRPGHTGAQYL